MRKFISIYSAAVALMAICGLVLTSCDAPVSGSVLEVSIKNPSVGSGKGEQFVNVKCAGNWTLALVADEGSVNWARLNVTEGSGNKSNVKFAYDVNDTEKTRSLSIVLDNGSKWVACSFEQLPAGGRPDDDDDDDNKDPGTGSNPDDGSGNDGKPSLADTGWLELPSMDNQDLGYYSHSFEMNGKRYRNYTFGWSQKDRVALWVAYPLCKLYTNGSAGRTEEWAMDPLLGDDSAAPFGGYAGDYDRGHQVASADRQCCYEANAQTYYGTNMTPQLPALNQKIWAKLEDKVRGYANTSDTTYVVTGCMVSASSKIEKDSYKNDVTVPDSYFKAVLKYSKSSTLGTWNAVAFYFEHRAYSESSPGKQHAMSIDQLEEITGLDFFVNLPAKIGEEKAAKIEAADPTTSDVWW